MATAQKHYADWRMHVVHGKRIWCRHKPGPEKTLVLFTGLGTSGTRMNKVFDGLAEKHKGRILGVEMPGQGISERMGMRITNRDYAWEIQRILETVLPDFDPGKTILVGHCHSPYFINAYAQETEVAGTVLANPFPLDSRIATIRASLALGLVSLEHIARKARRTLENPGSAVTKDAVIDRGRKIRSFVDAAITWNSTEYGTQKNQSPALIIVGEDDGVIPMEFIEDISRRIANSQVKVIPGGTHFGTYREPEGMVELVLEFTQKIST